MNQFITLKASLRCFYKCISPGIYTTQKPEPRACVCVSASAVLREHPNVTVNPSLSTSLSLSYLPIQILFMVRTREADRAHIWLSLFNGSREGIKVEATRADRSTQLIESQVQAPEA